MAVSGSKASKVSEFQKWFSEAHEAGMAAGNASVPTPMVVGSPSTPFGNDIDPKKPTYFVADGVCGFAWVNVKPGTSSFAKWMVKSDKARKDAYYGGVTVWVGYFGQSMTRKEAYASAFANVLRKYGVTAYANSRMD